MPSGASRGLPGTARNFVPASFWKERKKKDLGLIGLIDWEKGRGVTSEPSGTTQRLLAVGRIAKLACTSVAPNHTSSCRYFHSIQGGTLAAADHGLFLSLLSVNIRPRIVWNECMIEIL